MLMWFFLRTAEIQKNLFRAEGLKITFGNWETSIHDDSVTVIPGLNLSFTGVLWFNTCFSPGFSNLKIVFLRQLVFSLES